MIATRLNKHRSICFIKVFFLGILITFSNLVKAQNAGEKVEAIKVAFLTEKLDLSVDDAKIFWPIYNDYNKEQSALRKDRMQKMISFRKVAAIDELSDNDIQTLIANDFDFRQKELNVEKKYYNKFKSSGLSMKTIGKFYRAQEAFKKELLNRFRGGPRKTN